MRKKQNWLRVIICVSVRYNQKLLAYTVLKVTSRLIRRLILENIQARINRSSSMLLSGNKIID